MSKDKQIVPGVEISKRLVFVNSASSAATRLFNVVLLVWMYEYLLQRITPEEFAIFPVVTAVIIFAPLFSSLFTGGISRYVIDAYARGSARGVTEIVSSILPLLAAGGLAILGAGLVFSWYIDKVLTVSAGQIWDARIMMALLVLNFVFETVMLPYGVGFYVKQRFVRLNMIHIARDLLRMAILLVLLVGVSPRVLWVVVATVTASMASIVAIAWLSRRMIPELRFEAPLFNWAKARELLSFGLWATLGQFASMVYSSAGAIVLNKLGTALDVTTYHMGAMFDRQIRSMAAMASEPVQPALTAMHSTGDRKRLGNAFLRGGRYALWASLLVACPLMIYSTEFIQLYIGDRYLRTATVIVLLMSIYPFTYSNAILPKLAVATARMKAFTLGAFATQIVSVASMIYVVGWLNMGAVGVASVIAVTLIVSQVIYFWPMGLRMAQVSLKRFLRETLLPGLAPAAAGMLVWLALKLNHPPETWAQLFAWTLLGHAVYALVLFRFCLQGHEKQDIRHFINKITAFIFSR